MDLGMSSPFFKNQTTDQDGYDFIYVTYPVDIDDYRLKMFRSDVFSFFDVRRIMDNGEYEYNILKSSAAANRLSRNSLKFSAIDVYGFNDKLEGPRYRQVLPEWVTRIIMNTLKSRAYRRDRRTGTIISTFYNRNRVSKDDLIY